ncbi:ABC transporter ATP-binding protein [Aedoeadaptatus pacaensis]|uniref:ABC transporter ATP-binding protein n=1 Tax=Aedoeadaptatus pacaensis TaxID=1776390 RepID=UPI000838F10A|nr:ABC transporter ATP-binding protein [Peptoniphilus pacaensis]
MNTYRKLFAYIPEKRGNGFLSAAFSVAAVCCHLLGYYCLWLALKAIFVQQNFSAGSDYALRVVVAFIAYGILYFLGTWMSHLAAFRLETRLREKGIDHLLTASNTFYDKNQSGRVRKIIDDNVEQTHMAVAHLIPDQTVAILTPILMFVVIGLVDLRLAAFFGVIVLLSGFLCFKMMGEKEFMSAYMEQLDLLNAEAVEYVRGMQVVKLFAAPIVSFKRLYATINDYADMVYNYSMSCRIPYVTFQWLLNLFIVVPVFYAVYRVGAGDDGGLWAAKALFFALFMGMFFANIMKIMYVSMYHVQANRAVDTLEGLFKEMEEKRMVFGKEKDFGDSSITFNHVDFSYEDEKILSDFSLHLDAGKIYAFVGPSGGGKSTIAKLVSGLYPVNKGDVMIGEKPIAAYDKDGVMEMVGMVFQQAKLFEGLSIYDNVRLADLEANQDEVHRALDLARCEEFKEKFPAGYDTVIGAEGVKLSGGECQRVAIARLFLKDPKILILDEASAAADPENEYEIQKAFSNLMKGRTTIMIAHRMSSIRGVDEILFIEGGKVVERGDHDALMKEDGRYARFVNLYHEANEWRIDG